MGVWRFFLDAAAGRASLRDAFVFCYLAFLFPVAALLSRARQLFQQDGGTVAGRVIVVLLAAYLAWVTVALWRCSPNTQSTRSRWLARGLSLFLGTGGLVAARFLFNWTTP